MSGIGTLLLVSARFGVIAIARHFLSSRGDAPGDESVAVQTRDGRKFWIGGVVVVPEVGCGDDSNRGVSSPDRLWCRTPSRSGPVQVREE